MMAEPVVANAPAGKWSPIMSQSVAVRARPRAAAPTDNAPPGSNVDRFGEFLRNQIMLDLERLTTSRQRNEAGTADHPGREIGRGFRECEFKARILELHRHCGAGHGPCDQLGTAYPTEDERGCPTRAGLGVPYNDRAGYRHRWRP